ncbi:CHAP domain-containing protein [Sphingobacterium sp. C459-1T]|uniref:CHAP domain-containing protein n=2 Tax=Sphingobacterium faecale TaxID=2803775 RepID=A0ABS1QXR3_9SPHI|nr:CHAP domain-containing protein [Sphingobacterium faecale]
MDTKNKHVSITQGLAAKLPAQAAGGSYFFSAKKYAKNSSLKPRSALRSKTFDTEEVHPSAIVKNFLGDKGSECKGLAYYTTSLQLGLISPLKQFPIKDDLLAYGVKGRKAIIYKNSHFAVHKDLPSVSSQARFQSKGRKKGVGTLETALIALRSRDEHRLNSLDLCGTFYQGKVPRWSADEDNKRYLILTIATAELGVKESTGNNDGSRVEEYLRYTNLGKGYEWCASFLSWCYGEAGISQPRNAWSPALFPKAKQIDKTKAQPADIFGIYGARAKRINHVGLVKKLEGNYIISIEGNSNNRVESRRRHLRTVHSIANWID